MKMIPKNEMIPGMWYNGYCRNAHMAKWDDKTNEFIYIRYKFVYMVDTIKHFEDVSDGQDGFIPVEPVARLDYAIINKVKKEVGY